MFNIKKFDGTAFKISLGLFFSVIIYYVNNFFIVLGSTEKISLLLSVCLPLLILASINIFMLNKLNENKIYKYYLLILLYLYFFAAHSLEEFTFDILILKLLKMEKYLKVLTKELLKQTVD